MIRRKRGRQGRVRLARRRFVERLEKHGPPDEVLRRYDAGEWRGTILEIEIQCWRHLYDGYDEDGVKK